MINRGIKVFSTDYKINKKYILDRLTAEEKEMVNIKESSYEALELPKTDLVTAFFSIPFCPPKYFDTLWAKIYDSLNDGGYFVGQLFGNRDGWSHNNSVNTFTEEKVKKYLKEYKIIKFEEKEYVRESDEKNGIIMT